MPNRRTTAATATANPRFPRPESDRDFAFDVASANVVGRDVVAAPRLARAGRSEHRPPTAGLYAASGGGGGGGGRNDSVEDYDSPLETSHDFEGGGGDYDYDYDIDDGNVDFDLDDDDNDEDAWRKPGRQFRSNLMRLDAKNSFQLKPECAIERYYQVADRVMEQFLHHPIDDRDEVIEAYLIGSRLVHFLSSILPTHPEYFSPQPTLARLRDRAQSQLSELTGYAEVLAIMLDKQEHERYVSRVLLAQEEEPTRGAEDRAKHGDSDLHNLHEREGGDRNEEDPHDQKGDSLGGLRSTPRAGTGDQRMPHGQRSRPPLAARHSSASSSSSAAVPTFEIDVRRRRDGNAAGAGSNTGSRSRSTRDDSTNFHLSPEPDDRSASQDSSQPLLVDDSQPRRQYRFGVEADDDHDDWDVAWVRRHGRMHAVLDQESSVATGDSSNVERSTVDSSLMNPPEPRYSPLVSASNASPSRRRRDMIPTSYANRAAGRSSSSSGAMSEEGMASRRRDHSPQAQLLLKHEKSHEPESQRRFPQKRDDKDSAFLREGSAAGDQSQSFDGVVPQNACRGVREDSSATGWEMPAAGWDQYAANPSSSGQLAIESATGSTTANQNHPPTNSGRFSTSAEERKKLSRTGQSSPSLDVLEDPENRLFGDDDSVSVMSNENDVRGDFRSQDPYDESFLPDPNYDGHRYLLSSGNPSEHHLDATSSKRETMSKQNVRQDHDVAWHHTNRRYVPGSIRERAALRRQSSDAAHPRFDEEPANGWVDFGRFDADEEGHAQRSPVPLVAAYRSSDPFELKSEIKSAGTQYRHDPFVNHDDPSSALLTADTTTRETLAPTESTRLSSSTREFEMPPTTDSSRRLIDMQALPTLEEKGFKVSVTVDGKECGNLSDSLKLQTNETVPNHRQSSVRASAERLKELRSRRLDFRARALEECPASEIPNDPPPVHESTSVDQAIQDMNHSEGRTQKESTSEAEIFCVEELSADVKAAAQLELNTSVENDSVLNGEVEQILTRESSMMRTKYESFNTSGSLLNEDVESSAESRTPALPEAFDCSDDRCEGDDEASQASIFDPFFDEDSSARRDHVETRKRQEVLIEAMRLEQRTYLNSSPPRISERGKLIPSSRDAYYMVKRKSQATATIERPSNKDRRAGPVDLDATVDEDDDSDRADKKTEMRDMSQKSTLNPSEKGFASTAGESPVANRTRIEERMNEARQSKHVSSPTSVLAPPENLGIESPEKRVSRTASSRRHTTQSSSESAATTQGTFGEDDDDTALMNGFMVRKRRPMTHFRGCVRFLLE